MNEKEEPVILTSADVILYLLYVIRNFSEKEKIPKSEIINAYSTKKTFPKDSIDNLDNSFNMLIKKGLILENNNLFSLSEDSRNEWYESVKNVTDFVFSKLLLDVNSSQTYKKLAREVYGIDVGQFSMVDQEQIEKMLSILNLTQNDKVLDLGCGLGKITEYIHKKTQAQMVGIDLASKAIELANERNRDNNNNLIFKHDDINNPNFPNSIFDVIISIDTLYFVEDLFNTLNNLKRILKPSGRFLIFYSQNNRPNEPESYLLPDNTRLAQVLKKMNLKFTYYDFSERDKDNWRLAKQLTFENKENYVKEGKVSVFESRMDELNYINTLVEADKTRRYMYEVNIK